MINKYPENANYVNLLREKEGVNNDNKENFEKNVKILDELIKEYPKSQMLRRYRLRFLEGEAFKNAFDEYIRPFFIKALPSVFSDVKELCRDAEKLKIIEDLIVSHKDSLETKNTFAGSDVQEAPTSVLWSYLFLAELYNFKGEYNKALDYVEKVIRSIKIFIV